MRGCATGTQPGVPGGVLAAVDVARGERAVAEANPSSGSRGAEQPEAHLQPRPCEQRGQCARARRWPRPAAACASAPGSPSEPGTAHAASRRACSLSSVVATWFTKSSAAARQPSANEATRDRGGKGEDERESTGTSRDRLLCTCEATRAFTGEHVDSPRRREVGLRPLACRLIVSRIDVDPAAAYVSAHSPMILRSRRWPDPDAVLPSFRRAPVARRRGPPVRNLKT